MLGLQFGNVMRHHRRDGSGLGRLAFDSVLRRDYPTILGAAVLLHRRGRDEPVTDLCYRLIDPRIKAPES
jgi:peptide/nickel transport system permease protein